MTTHAPTVRFLAISGSLRVSSSNTALLRAAAQLAPAGIAVHLYTRLGELPHFNPDIEGSEPAVVKDFAAQVGAADGLIFSSP
jgi:NAD(P)H-dependent FMN reductase